MNVATNPGPVLGNYTAAANTAFGLRVHLNSSSQWAITGIAARGHGHAVEGIASGARGPVRLIANGGVLPAIASEAIAVGDAVYSAASGKMSKTSGGGAVLMGTAFSAAGADGDQFTYVPTPQT